ncbi:hypothetical protein F5Y18DRAFT_132207 [Xylariaceae sp. FL1019]|nr:hypothetical protein F5Y18DRAFT_132207 [Xylariaceae sp. FL1019]
MKNFGTLLMILAAAASYSVTALPAPGTEPTWIQARNNGPRFEAIEVLESRRKHHKGNGGNNNNNNAGGGNAVANGTATAVAGAASGAASGAPAADTGNNNNNNGKGHRNKNNILQDIEAQGGNALTALEDLLSRDE